MQSQDIVCVAPVGDVVGEGAVWSAADASVYWTDVCRFLIHCYDARAGSTRTWFFDEPVVALSLTSEPGRWLVALASKLVWWWPANDRRVDQGFVLNDYPHVRFNDGRADAQGNFWVGTMRNNVLPNGDVVAAGGQDGVLYRVAPDGAVTEHVSGLGISNTICWSPSGDTFYTADTLANAVWAYAFDPNQGALGPRRNLLLDHPAGAPDGSAMDAQGYLWNCRFGGQCLVRVAPDGRIDRVLQMPVRDITTACFGGEDLKTLFITSAAVSHHPGERLAGSLWSVRCEVPGLPQNVFKVNA